MEKKKGRKSEQEQGVVVPLKPKPDAPKVLSDEEAAVWGAVWAVHPYDWMAKDQYPVLVQYCKHVVSARHIAQLIERLEAKDFNTKEYLELLKAQERESRAIMALARSMRITNQTRKRSDSATARPVDEENLPWKE